MTSDQKVQAFSERIKPHLEELGVTAFVMVAYMEDEDGKISRITIGGNGGNAAMEDGLRQMQILAARWGQGQL